MFLRNAIFTKFSIKAASFLVRSMGRVHQVIAATPLCVLAWGGIVAPFEVQPLSSGQSVRATAIPQRGNVVNVVKRVNDMSVLLSEGTVFIKLPILIRASSKLRA